MPAIGRAAKPGPYGSYVRRGSKRVQSLLAHYAAEVGDSLAIAYGLLDDASWPGKPLTRVRFSDLDKFDRFQTIHTQRRGIRISGGALLIRGDGTVEERDDFHEALFVLA